MRISIIGTGYVGLITGVGLALRGQSVICVDKNPEIIRQLQRGAPPIHEKGLEAALRQVREANTFQATTNLPEAVAQSELTLIAVGTPNSQGRIDLSYVKEVAQEIGQVLRDKAEFHTVALKSTVLPGTTDSVVLPLLEQTSRKKLGDFGIGFNPEFLREGTALDDFLNPDRIVLGADDPRTAQQLRELYAGWEVEFVEVNTRTAEMIKYANNCLLATQISVTNELANLAATLGGIDATAVMCGVHLDHRWNPRLESGRRANPGILAYLLPGCGFGGSCFPKDVEALVAQGRSLGLPMRILEAVLQTNQEQPKQVVRLLKHCLGDLRGRKIAILGIAFKPDTDDLRQSASLVIIRELLSQGAQVAAADPVAYQRAGEELAGTAVAVSATWQDAARGAEAVVIATAWDEYRHVSPAELKGLMAGDLIVDARDACPQLQASDLFRAVKIGCMPKGHSMK